MDAKKSTDRKSRRISFRVVSFLFCLLSQLLCLVACGSKSIKPPQSLRAQRAVEYSSSFDSNQPFSFKVLQEFNDGKNLYVVAEVESRANWPTADMAVHLMTLKDGELLRESSQSLQSLIAPGNNPENLAELKEGTARKFSMSVPSQGMSDYQLELLWGEEAQAYLSKPQNDSGLELRKLQYNRIACTAAVCPLEFEVSCELFNSGETIVNIVHLGTSWVLADDLSKQELVADARANEEMVTLKALNLKPGTGRELKVKIAAALPQDSDKNSADKYKPEIRVVSYEG